MPHSTTTERSPDCFTDQGLPAIAGVDDHRYADLLRHGGTHRAEQHPGESASAMATNDDELSTLGLVDEMASRVLKLDHAVNGDLRIAFLPADQALAERFFGR